MNSQFYAGTSGLVSPVRNKTHYPPAYQEKSRLCYYSSLFNSIEINSSFYKLPQAKTIRRWVDETDENFRFTFKLWRNITHNKGLAFNANDVQLFMNAINEAGTKKGCLLVQFPASVTSNNFIQLEILLKEISVYNQDEEWKVAVEFRHRSWYTEEIYDLLSTYKATTAIHDMPNSITPMAGSDTSLVYLRFHGPGGGYRGSYNDDFLYDYAQYIKEWQQDGKAVYTYFNNTMGEAVKNLATLNEYVNTAN